MAESTQKNRVLIAMSGGVDSSVAVRLMMDAGYECVGGTMRLFEKEDPDTAGDAARDAEAVAEKLGIPWFVFDFTTEFRCEVVDTFVKEYLHGRTPNPCLDCNRELKFGRMMQRAEELGCTHIVTGHYARIEQDPQTGKYLLRKGLDETKDQSYVLYNMTQNQLAHTLLPLGEMRKADVRALAEKHGFINADRPDSQDICFVPDGDYAAVIGKYLEAKDGKTPAALLPGDFLDLEGNVIGTHKGIIHYTIGQHKRLGQAFGVPRYVCRIDAEANTITLGGPEDVFASYAKAGRFNWISGETPDGEIRCKVRLRYKQKEQWATVRPVRSTEDRPVQSAEDRPVRSTEDQPVRSTDGPEHGGADAPACSETVEIFFDEPQRAITPGQAAVLYDGDIVLGGGTIL